MYSMKMFIYILDSDREDGGRNLLRNVGNSLPNDMRLDFFMHLKCLSVQCK